MAIFGVFRQHGTAPSPCSLPPFSSLTFETAAAGCWALAINLLVEEGLLEEGGPCGVKLHHHQQGGQLSGSSSSSTEQRGTERGAGAAACCLPPVVVACVLGCLLCLVLLPSSDTDRCWLTSVVKQSSRELFAFVASAGAVQLYRPERTLLIIETPCCCIVLCYRLKYELC